MSRQGEEQERQMVPKRPRREDQLVPRLQPTMSMVPHVQGIDLMPAIRGVHEHMSTWMSSLKSMHQMDAYKQLLNEPLWAGLTKSILHTK